MIALFRLSRQLDGEGGPVIHFAPDQDLAAALTDDPVRDRQAKPGPASRLGGEERLEHAPTDRARHADPGVGHVDVNQVAITPLLLCIGS